MRTALVQELEGLITETRELVAGSDSDPDLETWQGYRARREVIFARLKKMDFQVGEEERVVVARLIEKVLQQNATLTERLKGRLHSLQDDMATVAGGRRALRGYSPSHAALLFERSA